MSARLRNLHFKYTVQDSGELHAHGFEDSHAFAYHPLSVLPFVEESPPLLSTNFATRGVLERERHAATNVLCRGRIPKQEPQKIPNTIISTMISVLPPTATFQTYMQENKRHDLIFLLRKAIQKLSKLQEIVQLVHSHA